jgi:hypothetical protein
MSSKTLWCLTCAKLLKHSALRFTAVRAAIAELDRGIEPAARSSAGNRNIRIRPSSRSNPSKRRSLLNSDAARTGGQCTRDQDTEVTCKNTSAFSACGSRVDRRLTSIQRVTRFELGVVGVHEVGVLYAVAVHHWVAVDIGFLGRWRERRQATGRLAR